MVYGITRVLVASTAGDIGVAAFALTLLCLWIVMVVTSILFLRGYMRWRNRMSQAGEYPPLRLLSDRSAQVRIAKVLFARLIFTRRRTAPVPEEERELRIKLGIILTCFVLFFVLVLSPYVVRAL
jgi:hypothetical protein